MDLFFKLLLVFHIAGGSLGLLIGTMNMIRRKGDKIHRLAGKIFTTSMLTAGFSALGLAMIHPSSFLFITGVFTIYMVGTGKRYIYRKMKGQNARPTLIDYALSGGMLLAGIIFIILGIQQLINQNSFGFVYLIFGTLGLRFVKADRDNYRGQKEKNYWLLAHLQRMAGGYIAALTAFLVVNAKHIPLNLPGLAFWLLPTLVITPYIYIWSAKYKTKAEG